MKKVLLSLMLSFVLICVYLTISTIFVFATDNKLTVGSIIDYPLRLPKIIFYYFFPPNQDDFAQVFSLRKLTVGLVVFFGNLILYSLPIALHKN
jgi:hypothetical protein